MAPIPAPPAPASPDSTALRLRAPANRVSRRAIRYWATRAAAGWLVPVGSQVLSIAISQAALGPRLIAVIATAVLAGAHCTVMPQWRYRVHRWETTPTAVYTQSGWFDQERRIAPISRIQTVDSERGPFEQIFGLANVTVTTASAAGPLTVKGLDRDVAAALVDDLTRVTEADRSDAT